MTSKGLSINGLQMPSDFPTTTFEAIYASAQRRERQSPVLFEQFGGAWNAVAYRYLAVCDEGDAFSASLANRYPSPQERYLQERSLFGFFSNGFSVFEATFFGLFALGAFARPIEFPLATPRDQQRVNPSSTIEAFKKAMPSDPIGVDMESITGKREYIEWREIRNILTHRAAPGRTFFVGSFSDDPVLPDEWKIKNIRLDAAMVVTWRAILASFLKDMTVSIEKFCVRNI